MTQWRPESEAPPPGAAIHEPRDTEPAPPPDEGDRPTNPPGHDPIEDRAHQEILEVLETGISKRLDPLIARVDALVTLVHRVLDQALDVTALRENLGGLDARLRAVEVNCPHCRASAPPGNGVSVPPGE